MVLATFGENFRDQDVVQIQIPKNSQPLMFGVEIEFSDFAQVKTTRLGLETILGVIDFKVSFK